MAEFYKYVKRDGQNNVDWGKIGQDMSTGLKQVFDEREDKRQELDDVNQSLMTAANEVEMGQNKTFNQFVLDGSAQTKDFLLMQNKLLKKGLLNPNEYTRAMQTVKDDWSSFSTATKDFNKTYKEAFDRLNDGTMSAEEAFKKESLFKFGNVQNKGIFVNPMDGRLYIAERDDKGKIITDPSKLVSVASMNNMINEKINKFDVVGAVAKGADKMAPIVNVLRQKGILTLDDARQNPMYKKAKDDFISSMLANPKQATSVLGDYIGEYDFTYNKSEAGGNTIYLKKDGDGVGQAELTKEQEKTAREALDAAFEAQVESKQTPMPTYAPQRATGAKDDDDMSVSYGNALKIASGSADAPGLAQAISKNPNSLVSNIVASPESITIEFKDKRAPEVISRMNPDGTQMSVDQVAQAIFPYMDSRANPAKVAEVADKYNKKYGQTQVNELGTFGEINYESISDKMVVANVNGAPTQVSIKSSIMQIDPDIKNWDQLDAAAKNINSRIEVAPHGNKDYVKISFPGTTTKMFPLQSPESLSRISTYLESLNQYIFNKQKNSPAPPKQATGGVMSDY
jgi:hypothetical protein